MLPNWINILNDLLRPNDLCPIVSDGVSDNREETFFESRIARQEGIHIIALGVGDPQWLDMVELKHMASYPADANVLQVDDFDALGVVTDRIRDAICNSKSSIFSLCETFLEFQRTYISQREVKFYV